jgi:hypothetical protein
MDNKIKYKFSNVYGILRNKQLLNVSEYNFNIKFFLKI